MDIQHNILLIGGRRAEDLVAEFGSPLYVYDAAVIRARFRELREAITYPNVDLHYACKANTNLAILRLLHAEGAYIDAVSPGEVFLALTAGFSPEHVLFTGNNVTDEEMEYVLDRGILVNVDSLSQLDRYGRLAPDSRVSLRINPDVGSGHHDHCITGGPDSKFGIVIEDVDQARQIIAGHRLQVVGLHAHVGSGILEAEPFLQAADALLDVVRRFEGLEFVDFGGGLGVPYRPDEPRLAVRALGARVSERFHAFCHDYGRPLTLKLEPGRYVVCEAGMLLTRCNSIKATRTHTFVGTDSGFNHLIRHPLYLSYHEIINASNVEDERFVYDVCGNICESADFFARGRLMSRVREGDVLAILNAGAYGFCMSSNYNSRPRPAEVLVDGGTARVIRARETLEDLLRGQGEF
ncbi:MAG: diaminopimelate decarboxylase [Candidatus Latescibacteria bacterium]|nr:diaminopimelate decarboxylase [Candidatus Latescibacterota bacterium]